MKLVCFILSLTFLSGCTPKKSEVNDKILLVGTDASYAPFEYQTPDNKIVGFEVELFDLLAQKEGLKIKYVNTPWDGIFNMLNNGDRDVLISAITITEERKQSLDFSDPYFEAKQLIAVGMKSVIKNLEDLKDKKIGIQTATTADDILQKTFGKTNSNIKRYESIPLALKELESGGVDAVMADNGVVANYIKNNAKNFKLIDDAQLKKENYGIAVRKGNKELLEKINRGIKSIKADGSYTKLYEKYFGVK